MFDEYFLRRHRVSSEGGWQFALDSRFMRCNESFIMNRPSDVDFCNSAYVLRVLALWSTRSLRLLTEIKDSSHGKVAVVANFTIVPQLRFMEEYDSYDSV